MVPSTLVVTADPDLKVRDAERARGGMGGGQGGGDAGIQLQREGW